MSRLPNPFRFPIPVDPFRAPLAIAERWKRLVLLGLLFGAAGLFGGTRLLEDKYTVAFTIFKGPASRFEQGNEGALPSPYQPPDLKNEAIVVAASSDLVIETATASLDPEKIREASELGWRGEIEEMRRSGLFELKVMSNVSPEAAVAMGRAWADAVIGQLQRQQQRAAADAAAQVSKRIAQHRLKLDELNRELLEKAEEADMFDEVSKMQSLYVELAELRAARAIADSDLETKVGLFVAYQREVRGLNWLRDEIRRKGNELNELRGKVTGQNPQYIRLKAEITALNQELEKVIINDRTGQNDPLISSTVYGDTRLTMLRLEEEKSVLAERIERYHKLIEVVEAEIEKLPARAISMADSKAKWREAIETSATLETYLKEAEFYQREALSPLRYLVEPEGAAVEFGSKYVKAGLLGLLSGLFFVFLTSLAISLRELKRPGLRTPLQAAISTGSVPLLQLPSSDSPERRSRMRDFWLTAISSHMPGERNFLFVSAGDPAEDCAFWNGAFDALDWDMPRVVFVDVSSTPFALSFRGEPLPLLDESHPTRYQISAVHLKNYTCEKVQNLKNLLPPDTAVVVRWSIPPSAVLRQLFLGFDRYYTLASVKTGSANEVESKSRLLRDLLGESAGLILTDTLNGSGPRKFVNRLEMNYLANSKMESLPEPVGGPVALPNPEPWLA